MLRLQACLFQKKKAIEIGKLKYDIVGQTFKNKKGLAFVVVERTGCTETKIPLYKIKFLQSGYEADDISSGHIRKGEVKDYFSPSVFGVGCLGYAWNYAKRKESRRIYYTWRNMIRRCYDETSKAYKWYGAKGIFVCDRWHRLDYFVEDLPKIPGFDPVLFEESKIELDKDIRGNGNKYYSLETCCFVSHAVNAQDCCVRRWHPKQVCSKV